MPSQPVIVRTIKGEPVHTSQQDSDGQPLMVVIDVSASPMFPRAILADHLRALSRHFHGWDHGFSRHEAAQQADKLFDHLAGAIADWVEANVPGIRRLTVHRPHGGESLEYSWPVPDHRHGGPRHHANDTRSKE